MKMAIKQNRVGCLVLCIKNHVSIYLNCIEISMENANWIGNTHVIDFSLSVCMDLVLSAMHFDMYYLHSIGIIKMENWNECDSSVQWCWHKSLTMYR